MPGPRRRQPEEHPRGAGRTCVPRCGVRVVRRPGLRPRVLPEPPAAEVRVGTLVARGLPRLLRRAARRVSFPRALGERRRARAAHRDAAAGPARRPHRRQVAGRVPGRAAARARAPHRARFSFPEFRLSRGASRGMARILDIKGRRVWDSRGRPTVEAEVTVGRGATPLATGRAIAPAGASTGSGEAKALDVAAAVSNVNTVIRAGLRALSVADQAAIDRRLIELDGTPDKSRLGANATVAVSLACAHADAMSQKVPLWKKLAGDRRVSLPVPQIQIFGGGAHARGSVDLQDYMVICIGAGSFAEALEWTAQIYAVAGKRLAKRGALHGVADEGGYWPAFRTN